MSKAMGFVPFLHPMIADYRESRFQEINGGGNKQRVATVGLDSMPKIGA